MNIRPTRYCKSLSWPGLTGLIVVILGMGTAQAAPSEPHLVKDINTDNLSSYPSQLVNVDGASFGQAHGVLFFVADDGVHGEELWMSDGTEAGTVLVKDIDPGGGDSYLDELTDVDGTLFFVDNDDVLGDELWKSDGTEAGTVLVKDFSPTGADYSYLTNLVNVDGTLFFGAYSYDRGGDELWKSDGTEAGTVLVRDIDPGEKYSYPFGLTNVNGTLFFIANDGIHGEELWKSDGTEAGTVLVKDVYPGSPCSHMSNLVNVNGTLFFTANDGLHGSELWKSDGTEVGTLLVKVIGPESSPGPGNLTNVNGTLFFSVRDSDQDYEKLYKSDGTRAGTVLVKDIDPGLGYLFLRELTSVNDTLFFKTHTYGSDELWKSDGTQAGTVRIEGASTGSGFSDPEKLTKVGDALFFSAYNSDHRQELYKSDGTQAGTVLVKDINPGPGSSSPDELTDVNGTLFFVADDGVHGEELWAGSIGVDLALSKKVTASTEFLLPRDAISYTLTYRNVGDAVASGVVISDTLPDGLTQLSLSSSGAAITHTPGVTYAWQVQDLGPGEGGVISITGLIDPAFAGGVLTNTATISGAMAETNDDNNVSSTAVTVYPPALRVFKSVQGPGAATTNLLPNDVVTYTITLDNSLNQLAAGVVMTDPLPLGVSFGGWVQRGLAQLPPPGGTGSLNAEVIGWGPWDMAAGEEASSVFTATVAPGSAWLGNPVLNTAWFSSTNAGSGSASAAFSVKVMDVFLPLLIKQ